MFGHKPALLFFAAWVGLATVPAEVPGQTTWHVDVNASGPAHDGTTWCHAFGGIQEALNVATSGDRIRVAQGTYKPDPTGLASPRNATFRLLSGVSLEGGYAGCGAVNPDARDYAAFETTLSGDLGGNDGPNFANYAENCYHVVTYDDPNATNVIFEGFTVSGGNANGPSGLTNQGGGIHIRQLLIKCIPGGPTIRHCIVENNWGAHHGAVNDHGLTTTIDNCTIRNNHSGHEGGGLQSHSGNPMVTNCSFFGNVSDGEGGGAWMGTDTDPTCTGGSTATFINCTFDGNTGELGGGLYTSTGTEPTVIGCTFIRNTAVIDGAGIYSEADSEAIVEGSFFIDNDANSQGGGVYNVSNAPRYTDCVFRGNSAGLYAGAMRNLNSLPVITGCVFADNSSASNGGAFHNRLSRPTFDRCSFFGNIAATNGAAIFNIEASSSTLRNSLFSGNRAGHDGGAISNREASHSTLYNCTLNANTSLQVVGGIENDTQSHATLINSIVWNQSGVAFGGAGGAAKTTTSFSNIQGGFAGVGNINASPLFVDANGADNVVGTEDDDLRLQGGSPGINVGDPTFTPALDEEDLFGGLRLVECRVDMGSCESNVLQRHGDFNADGAVNLADFAKFQLCAFHTAPHAAWRDACVCVFDLDGSNFVDLVDYAKWPWDLGPCDDDDACDDGDACNGEEQCVDGVCQSGTPMECDDGNICTDDSCEGGVCVRINNAVVCDDGDACTNDDRCDGGSCVGNGPPPVCNDNNPCTDDSCEPAEGCVFVNNSNPCNDGNPCTVNAACSNGSCQSGTPVDCSAAGGPCETAACDPTGGEGNCDDLTPVADGTGCDDSNECTTGDSCSGGSCAAGPPTVCNDDNPCTDDSCAPVGGCAFTNNDANACTDGNACTKGDQCEKGDCLPGGAVSCDSDNNPCTDDSCDPASGCVWEPDDGNTCADDNVCNGVETCSGGICQPGTPLSCPGDNNPCTEESCDTVKGCQSQPDDGQSCNDGSICTSGDFCSGGTCMSGSMADCSSSDTACKTASCDPAGFAGNCDTLTPVDDGTTCNDGQACLVGETCQAGSCVGGNPQDCSSLDADCKTFSCNPAGSEGNCDHSTQALDETECDDNNKCTTDDSCTDGHCKGEEVDDCP